MGVTFDAAFLVDYLRSDAAARAKSADLDARSVALFLTTPALFEVLTGLIYGRSRVQAAAFRAMARQFATLPFDESAAERGALIRAELIRAGRTQSASDIMIAAIASVHGHSVVTRDRGFDFIAKVADLQVEAY